MRLAVSNPVLRATTIMFAVFNIGEGALLVLLPEQAHGRLFALLRTVMQATPPLGAGLAAVTVRLGGAATVWAVVVAHGPARAPVRALASHRASRGRHR